MKLTNPKLETLSPKQSAIWDAVNSCHCSRQKIADKAGYNISNLASWIIGRHEPKQSSFNAVMQAIEELNKELSA